MYVFFILVTVSSVTLFKKENNKHISMSKCHNCLSFIVRTYRTDGLKFRDFFHG